MTDAEFLREIADIYRKRSASYGEMATDKEAQHLCVEYGDKANRLEAIAKRLEGGVIVPREPDDKMLHDAMVAVQAANISVQGKLTSHDAHARVLLTVAYRAMLQAQEASDEV